MYSLPIAKYGSECKLPHQLFKTELRYRKVLNNFILDKYYMIVVNDNWCMILGDEFKDKRRNYYEFSDIMITIVWIFDGSIRENTLLAMNYSNKVYIYANENNQRLPGIWENINVFKKSINHKC